MAQPFWKTEAPPFTTLIQNESKTEEQLETYKTAQVARGFDYIIPADRQA